MKLVSCFADLSVSSTVVGGLYKSQEDLYRKATDDALVGQLPLERDTTCGSVLFSQLVKATIGIY